MNWICLLGAKSIRARQAVIGLLLMSHVLLIQAKAHDPAVIKLGKHRAFASALAFLPDEQELISGCEFDGNLIVWDTVGGKRKSTIETGSEGTTCIAINHAGRTMAVAGLSRKIELWDVGKASIIKTLSFAPNSPRSIRFGSRSGAVYVEEVFGVPRRVSKWEFPFERSTVLADNLQSTFSAIAVDGAEDHLMVSVRDGVAAYKNIEWKIVAD